MVHFSGSAADIAAPPLSPFRSSAPSPLNSGRDRLCGCRCRPDHSRLCRAQLGRLPFSLVGLLYLAAGVVLWLNPIAGMVALRCFSAAVLVVDGVFRSILAFQSDRGQAGSGCCWAASWESAWRHDLAAAALFGLDDPGTAARNQSCLLGLHLPYAGHFGPTGQHSGGSSGSRTRLFAIWGLIEALESSEQSSGALQSSWSAASSSPSLANENAKSIPLVLTGKHKRNALIQTRNQTDILEAPPPLLPRSASAADRRTRAWSPMYPHPSIEKSDTDFPNPADSGAARSVHRLLYCRCHHRPMGAASVPALFARVLDTGCTMKRAKSKSGNWAAALPSAASPTVRFFSRDTTGGYLNICLHPFVSGCALRITCWIDLSPA